MEESQKEQVFLAIPFACYHYEKLILKGICDKAGYFPYILADDTEPNDKKIQSDYIRNKIKESKMFLADLSFGRPNVALELGWAMSIRYVEREKKFANCKIMSRVKPMELIMSDLMSEITFTYGSLKDLECEFANWIIKIDDTKKDILIDYAKGEKSVLEGEDVNFQEDFKDYQKFTQNWIVVLATCHIRAKKGRKLIV